jgi:hypothetical protein
MRVPVEFSTGGTLVLLYIVFKHPAALVDNLVCVYIHVYAYTHRHNTAFIAASQIIGRIPT